MIGVIGEALIDFIGRGKEDTSVNFASYIGGSSLNTATACARQEVPTSFIGKVSQDMFGQRILEHLVDNQVLFDPTLCGSEYPSMIGFASLDEEGKATYAFYSKLTAPVMVSADELLSVLRENTDIRVLIIGSVSLAVTPGCDAILEAVDLYKPHPILFLDPNVRPAVIDDFEEYRKRIETAMQLASFIKLSDEDLLLLYPGVDPIQKAKSLASERKIHVILTLGRKGSLWCTPDHHSYAQPIIDLPLVDTVGAGDTFSGSLLSFMHGRGIFGQDGQEPSLQPLSKELIVEALKYATAASAINCSRKGCDPPTKEEIIALLS